MSAFDPQTQPDEVELRLRAWMADQRAGIDLTPTYTRIVERTGASRRRPRLLVRRGVGRTNPPSTWKYRMDRLAPIAIAALLLGLAIGAGILAGSRLDEDEIQPPPVPSQPAMVVDAAIDMDIRSTLLGDRRYMSSVFQPQVTFTTSSRHPGQGDSDICAFQSSARTIVLAHPKACIQELRFVRPWAVACGAAGDHPDAAGLAAAILALPDTRHSVDLGDLATPGAVPDGMFREPYHGRVVQMPGGETLPLVNPAMPDPDHCRLLSDPSTNEPVIEIRRDIAALFILLDLDGELVVIRASAAGHDAASRADAVERGYAAMDETGMRHLLGLVNDIRFGP